MYCFGSLKECIHKDGGTVDFGLFTSFEKVNACDQ